MPSSRAVAWIVRVSVAFVVVIAAVGWLRPRDRGAPAVAEARDPAEHPVEVRLATVQHQDLPVWLEGPGTVAASQQVTVHAQVDGRLDAVTFVEGQPVKKGAVIARIDPRPFELQVHHAEAQLAQDSAQLVAARTELDRLKALQKEGIIARSAVDTADGQARNAESAVRAAEVQLENAKLQLDYAAIKAPLSGITGVRQVDAGNVVRASDAGGIVVITAIDPAAIVFTVPQDRLGDISAALAAGDVPVEVWSRDGAQRLATAKLAVLDNQVDAVTATLRLKALVPNKDHKLWPNAVVKARVLVGTRANAVVVPASAVQRGPDGAYVYTVGADHVARMVPVTVGATSGDQSAIASGLAGGEQVVVDGADQVRPNARVELSH